MEADPSRESETGSVQQDPIGETEKGETRQRYLTRSRFIFCFPFYTVANGVKTDQKELPLFMAIPLPQIVFRILIRI